MYLMTPPPVLPTLDFAVSCSCPPLVLDLDEVQTLSAAGLGELVVLNARLRAMGGRLVLVNVSEMAYESLAIACLTDVLDVRRARVVRPAGDGAEGKASARDEAAGRMSGKM